MLNNALKSSFRTEKVIKLKFNGKETFIFLFEKRKKSEFFVYC